MLSVVEDIAAVSDVYNAREVRWEKEEGFDMNG